MSQCCLSSAISISNLFICCLSSPQIFTKVINCSVTARRHSISCLLVPSTDSSLQCFIMILELERRWSLWSPGAYRNCSLRWLMVKDILRYFPYLASHISVSQMSTEFSKKFLSFVKWPLWALKTLFISPVQAQPSLAPLLRPPAPGSAGKVRPESGNLTQRSVQLTG